jgi:endonuclease YncB( thermonuclease family)
MAETKLRIGGTPSNVQVYLNGTFVGDASGRDENFTGFNFFEGDTWNLEIKKTGYSPKQWINLKIGKASPQKISYALSSMTKVPPVTNGYLQINSEPSGANITINGNDTGFKTPKKLELKEGKHAIEIKLSGYSDFKTDKLVIAGETRTITFDLTKIIEVEKPAPPEGELPPAETPKVESDFTRALYGMQAAYMGGDYALAAKQLITLPFASAIPDDVEAVENVFPISFSFGGGGIAAGAGTAAGLSTKATGNLSWILKNWKWVAGALSGVAGTSTFVNFLYEEALQTAGMGVWVQISNKNWNEAAIQLQKARGFLEIADFSYKHLGWLNPLTWKVFKNYAEATEAQYDSYEKAIIKGGGVFPAPDSQDKVFNKGNWLSNLGAGKTPKASSLVADEVKDTIKEAEVTGITDGDTFKITGEEKIRIAGIDAPEFATAEGKKATAALRDLIYKKKITMMIEAGKEKDKYGRTLAAVKVNSKDVGLEMIKTGDALFYPADINKFVDDTSYLAAESAAKAKPAKPVETPVVVVPEKETPAETPAEITKITKEELFKETKTFYEGRMYMSKKELQALLAKHDASGIAEFITEIWSYYTGRMYLSKKEMISLGKKYNFDISGL